MQRVIDFRQLLSELPHYVSQFLVATWRPPLALVHLEPHGVPVHCILSPLFSRSPCSIFPIDMVKTRLIEQLGQQQRLYVT
jgi:hypothetical protein